MNQASFGQKTANKEYLDEPPQPRPEDPIPGVTECRRVRGVRYFPPVLPEGCKQLDILFVQISPLPEEASEVYSTPHGIEIPRKPGIGTGPAAQIIRETVNRFPNLHESRIGFASMVPWLLPKTRRFKPTKEELEKCGAWLKEKVKEINPKVVVAMGMPAFKALCPLNISQDDARYGWFATECGVPLYLSFPLKNLLTQPWTQDELITDVKEVYRLIETADREGGRGSFTYQVINNLEELQALVKMWQERDLKCFSVDCEWGRGSNHLTGDLRSIQFAWSDSEAAYLRFYDEENTRYLAGDVQFDEHGNDVYCNDYRLVGEILNQHLAKADVTYIGHHFTADSPWMSEVLGIPVLGRCVLDTEYALQSIDEYAPRGLESIALRYTDFGRYDMDLVMWKKANPGATRDGYEKIPDSILIPYAVKDVLAVWRARGPIERRMHADDVFNYYKSILNPFVTDVFHDFVVTGLPVNMELFQALRVFMNWAYRVLLDDFKSAMADQADDVVSEKTGLDHSTVKGLRLALQKASVEEAASRLLPLAAPGTIQGELHTEPWFVHWHEIEKFNIRSSAAMRRWLFEVSGFTPIKTTKGGADGTPSMLWEKAMELPENIRKTLNPATDKETLEILEKDDKSGLISRLLAVSNVGNQCKGFLKEGDVDEATGEVVEEHGLAKFIAYDNRIHGQFSLTETGRPRSWSPNILNLSSYHNKGVEAGLLRVLAQRPELELPAECAVLLGTREELEKKVAEAVAAKTDPSVSDMDIRKKVIKDLIKTQIPTVRSIVCAEPGWCFVESDYKTAEIRGLAFIFGDRALIRLMTEPDPTFAFDKDWEPVRLSYAADCGIPQEKQLESWVLTKAEDGKVIRKVPHEELQRDADGNIIHPPYDLHWTLAELVYKMPREELSSKRDRGAAKVANFSCLDRRTIVMTQRGAKMLIKLDDDDLVWDGEEFVPHGGVVHNGTQLTIEHRGIRATPDHYVWLGGEKGSLLELALKDLGKNYPIDEALIRLDSLGLKPQMSEVFDISDCGPRNRFVVLVPEDSSATIPPHEPQEAQNQHGSGNPGTSGVDSGRISNGVRGGDYRGGRIKPRGRFIDYPGSHPGSAGGSSQGDQGPYGSPIHPGAQGPRRKLQSQDGEQRDGGGSVARAAEGQARPLTPGFRQVIVSNCAYGAVATTIERRIEAVTGIKPAEGTGEALLAALEKRQPDVFRGLEEVAKKPQHGEILRAASGRVRRFPVHDAGLGGVSWRVRNSYLRAMGNEARNFFPQESVAATLARACRWLNNWYRAEGLKARAIVGLYDSVVTYCPLEERFVCSEAHEVFMHRINFWKYGRRYMNYPIDTDLVERWSFKPSKALKAQLTSKDFVPMDAERQRGILERLAAREKMIFDAQPWVLKNLNKAEIAEP